MDVLLVSTMTDTATGVVERLQAQGHDVHHCARVDGGCAGLRSEEGCPIDIGVEVAVLVADDTPAGQNSSVGALCAVRAAVPLVIVGDEPTAFDEVAAVIKSKVDSVGQDIESAQHAPAPHYERSALDALRQALRLHGIDDTRARVEVEHAGRGLRVRLVPGAAVDRSQLLSLSVRVHAALRKMDAAVVSITVSGG